MVTNGFTPKQQKNTGKLFLGGMHRRLNPTRALAITSCVLLITHCLTRVYKYTRACVYLSPCSSVSLP